MDLISLLIWIIIVVLVAGAVLGVVRAVLALPAFATIQPYAAVVYALCVLLVVLIAVSMFSGGVPAFRLPGWR